MTLFLTNPDRNFQQNPIKRCRDPPVVAYLLIRLVKQRLFVPPPFAPPIKKPHKHTDNTLILKSFHRHKITLEICAPIFYQYSTLIPGSSVVEQATVNRLAAGSSPAQGATFRRGGRMAMQRTANP
jgi:hypothetical protein